MDNEQAYQGREPARIKHDILRRYLMPFALKVGHTWDTITYIDGFCGPWQAQTKDYSDTSFGIAIAQLREARNVLHRQSRNVRIRFAFVEENKTAFRELERFCRTQPDVDILPLNKTFADAVPELVKFVGAGSDAFSFVLLDPKGWYDADISCAKDLFRSSSSEVLVNFMTDFFRRGAASEDPTLQARAASLLGGQQNLDAFHALSSSGASTEDKEDHVIDCYCRHHLARFGGFKYAVATPVLFPSKDRTKYHLVYGSRSIVGLSVFREVERKAAKEQDAVRDTALERERKMSGIRAMFSPEVMGSGHLDDLRIRHCKKAKAAVLQLIAGGKSVSYDELFECALSHQLTWEPDLREWISGWVKAGSVEVLGGTNKQQPSIKNGIVIRPKM